VAEGSGIGSDGLGKRWRATDLGCRRQLLLKKKRGKKND
jgi:hypothetical protein